MNIVIEFTLLSFSILHYYICHYIQISHSYLIDTDMINI